MFSRPQHVGILAVEAYVPANQVNASDLEAQDGVPGKYTKGLEMVALSFCFPCEDAVSMALTCVHRLLETHEINPKQIGRLEVGSESSPDRSKSIKSHLMRLLSSCNNHDVEGVDCVHGCYGATSALLNSVSWVEGSSWDGRYAMVVATDWAAYPPASSARATGGAAAVAFLVGPDAPLVLDPAWRATYARDTNEFCKPAGAGPYPVFNAKATLNEYMHALDGAYASLHKRLYTLNSRIQELRSRGQLSHADPKAFDVSNGILPLVSFVVCHAPFSRLVRKAFARMALHDALRSSQGDAQLRVAGVPARWRVCDPEALPGAGYDDKELESALLNGTRQAYDAKVLPGAWAQQLVGNAYTASLYLGLAALWERQGPQLEGRRVLLFSFGSGTQASVLSLVGRNPTSQGSNFTLEGVAAKVGKRGARSSGSSCDSLCEETCVAAAAEQAEPPRTLPWEPHASTMELLRPNTWHLESVGPNHQRSYVRNVGGARGTPTGSRGSQDKPSSSKKEETRPAEDVSMGVLVSSQTSLP